MRSKGTRKVKKRGGGWLKDWWNRPRRGEVYFPHGSQKQYNEQVAAARKQDDIRREYNLNKIQEKKCETACKEKCKNSYKFKNVVGARNTVGVRMSRNGNTRRNSRNWSSFSPSV